MDTIGTTVGILIAGTLLVIAAHFAWRQRQTLHMLRANSQMPVDQRRFLLRQCGRRFFGSLLLFLLAGLMIGAVFLDFEPQEDREASRQAARFLGVYVMGMLLMLLVVLVLAILDFWATARFSLQQQKQLLAEHQAKLEADLLRLRRRSDPD